MAARSRQCIMLDSGLMSTTDCVQKEEGTLVLPGEELCGGDLKSGSGTYRKGNAIYAAQLGTVNYRSGFINVAPVGGKYLPRVGDSVIGMVQDVGASNWMVDVNCPYLAFLHANETQWKVDFGNAAQFLGIGDIILAKIGMVDETKHVNLTMKEQGLRKMTSGQVVKVSHTKVPMVIGRGGSMISLLKEHTGCRIFIGQNGVIWIDGETAGTAKATAAIMMLVGNGQTHGSPEDVRAFLNRNATADAKCMMESE